MSKILDDSRESRPSLFICGSVVLEVLKDSAMPAAHRETNYAWFGVPIVGSHDKHPVGPCRWKLLDQYGDVIKEGALALTFKEES